MQNRTRQTIIVGSGILFLLLLILYMGGFFATGLIEPEDAGAPAPEEEQPPATAIAEVREVTEYFEAVGTVRSRVEAKLEAQVMARIVAVNAAAGEMVEQGEELVVLDRRQLETRKAQAEQGLDGALAGQEQAMEAVKAAQAAFAEAEAQYQRIGKYYEKEAATERMLEEARSAFLQARAGLDRARQAVAQAEAGVRQARKKVEEAEISMGYTTLLAPISGEIAERLVDPGDMAVPGKPLLVLQAPETLRLDAMVRESLIGKIARGQRYRVSINALGAEFEAPIEEIVPVVDPRSRTFVVKAGLPALAGLHPGMFGRLYIPVSEERVILIPRRAVVTIGQLQVVRVQADDRWRNVAVSTGKVYGSKVEILSGLAGGETVALPGRGDG